MHLVDQATLEMFVSVLLDENEHQENKLYEYTGEDPGNGFIETTL